MYEVLTLNWSNTTPRDKSKQRQARKGSQMARLNASLYGNNIIGWKLRNPASFSCSSSIRLCSATELLKNLLFTISPFRSLSPYASLILWAYYGWLATSEARTWCGLKERRIAKKLANLASAAVMVTSLFYTHILFKRRRKTMMLWLERRCSSRQSNEVNVEGGMRTWAGSER